LRGGGIFTADQVSIGVQGDRRSRIAGTRRDHMHRHAILKKVRQVEMAQAVKLGALHASGSNLNPENTSGLIIAPSVEVNTKSAASLSFASKVIGVLRR
jgi:hypothetical protein